MCNQIANTPIFIGMTAGDDPATKKAVARPAVIVAFAITVVMAAAGKLIGELFGITLPAFKLGDGLHPEQRVVLFRQGLPDVARDVPRGGG